MRHRSRMIVGILAALLSSAVAVQAGQATRRGSESAQVRRAVRVARPQTVASTRQREVRQVRRAVRVAPSQSRATRGRTAGAPPRSGRQGGVTTRGYIRRGTAGRRGGIGAGVGVGSRVGGYVGSGRYPSGYRARYGGRRYGNRYSIYSGGYGYRPFGIGGYAGYGPYSYGYGYGYGYGYRPYYYGTGYGYGTNYLGALRLQVRPRHAEVLVDGYYAGRVDDFDGAFQRLRLEEGTYEIAIQAPGYAPLVFDVRLLPGQTVRYRGELRRRP